MDISNTITVENMSFMVRFKIYTIVMVSSVQGKLHRDVSVFIEF